MNEQYVASNDATNILKIADESIAVLDKELKK
jgi:hypothetical protein